MLELQHIHKYYNPGTVNEMCLFEDFNLSIKKGQFVSVVDVYKRQNCNCMKKPQYIYKIS